MVGVGTYNMAGARDCKIIGPKLPVVVILIKPLFNEVNINMMIGRRASYVNFQSYLVEGCENLLREYHLTHGCELKI